MDDATKKDAPPTANSFAEQELRMVRLVLNARGWTCTEARASGDTLTIIAHRTFPANILTVADLKN